MAFILRFEMAFILRFEMAFILRFKMVFILVNVSGQLQRESFVLVRH